jgi:hypothetical protein
MQKITQVEDYDVTLVVKIPESRRRHLKAEAARQDKAMGRVVEEALDKHLGLPGEKPRPPGDVVAAEGMSPEKVPPVRRAL